MDNDLSKCKVGDWVATLYGWAQIEEIGSLNDDYPILINNLLYTREGFFYKAHKAPSAFIDPPGWLLKYIGPKPCEFKKNELVMVRMRIDHRWCLRYFAQHKKKGYATYDYGKTSYTAKGAISVWKYCRKAVEGEDY